MSSVRVDLLSLVLATDASTGAVSEHPSTSPRTSLLDSHAREGTPLPTAPWLSSLHWDRSGYTTRGPTRATAAHRHDGIYFSLTSLDAWVSG